MGCTLHKPCIRKSSLFGWVYKSIYRINLIRGMFNICFNIGLYFYFTTHFNICSLKARFLPFFQVVVFHLLPFLVLTSTTEVHSITEFCWFIFNSFFPFLPKNFCVASWLVCTQLTFGKRQDRHFTGCLKSRISRFFLTVLPSDPQRSMTINWGILWSLCLC